MRRQRKLPRLLAPGGRLRELGAAVALSDLGGRDAGMALLAEIRPDFVRLAASLVRGIPGNAKNLRAIQAMIRAIGESGTKVIAAGISSPAERAACLEAGCELGQGPLFEERKRADAPVAEGQPRRIAGRPRCLLSVPSVGFDRAFVTTFQETAPCHRGLHDRRKSSPDTRSASGSAPAATVKSGRPTPPADSPRRSSSSMAASTGNAPAANSRHSAASRKSAIPSSSRWNASRSSTASWSSSPSWPTRA